MAEITLSKSVQYGFESRVPYRVYFLYQDGHNLIMYEFDYSIPFDSRIKSML